ncbi:MAG TPA: substrate-binding domain-containing protein, partial [Sedimentisphaerales bacterium]
LMARPHPPTAFLVSRAQYFLTAVTRLLSSGVKVPGDVALISRDNDIPLEAIVPSVARYSQKPKTFAATASRLVMEIIRGTGKIAEHKIMPNFIHGQTLG